MLSSYTTDSNETIEQQRSATYSALVSCSFNKAGFLLSASSGLASPSWDAAMVSRNRRWKIFMLRQRQIELIRNSIYVLLVDVFCRQSAWVGSGSYSPISLFTTLLLIHRPEKVVIIATLLHMSRYVDPLVALLPILKDRQRNVMNNHINVQFVPGFSRLQSQRRSSSNIITAPRQHDISSEKSPFFLQDYRRQGA